MQKTIKRRSCKLESAALPDSLHPLLQRVYAARNIVNEQQISNDLTNVLKPNALKGLINAVHLIADAVETGQRILIIGDFDADGATSSALAVLALRSMGAVDADFLVPNRFEYGYGLTPEIVEVASARSPDLIITVDNGISSIDGVKAARQRGIKVVVTDHHLPGEQLPCADAIVNPNQHGCEFASKSLAGVGVIFYVMSALRAQLRQCNWFVRRGLSEPNMAEFLDLVALGTVADVVPLDHNNRILVEQGLRRIRAGRCRPGIKALLEVANRSVARVVSADLGFAAGPRLNAAGRLDDMSLGIQCLLADDENTARDMASQMDDLNRDRKAIESAMQREAVQGLNALNLTTESLPYGICLYDANWHQGVIGILASRIKDKYHRPVIAFADAGNGTAQSDNTIKGSARSIPGLHIRDVLDSIAAKHPHLLAKFGGHAMAAGMSLSKDDFAEFAQVFDAQVRCQLNEEDLQSVLYTDGELNSEDFSLDLAKQLRHAGPWGQHFPEPVFDGVFHLVQQRIVGGKHLKMVLAMCNDSKCNDSKCLIDGIAFNIDTCLWPNSKIDKVKIAYKLDVNAFRGKESMQLIVDYIEPLN